MSNATPSRLGQSQAAGDARALFLTQFSGEVLTAFRNNNVFEPLHMTRTISGAKSAQFIATGIATAAYHTPGSEILGTAIKHAEKTISIDGLLIAHSFISDWDEWVSHFDVSGEYSYQLGAALALKYDTQVAQVIAKAARTAATTDGHSAGTVLNSGATVVSDATVLSNAMWSAAENLDVKKVTEMERYVALAPAQYYLLIRGAKDFIDRDYSPGNGDYAKGQIKCAAGFTIVKSLNLPTTNIASNDALEFNDYSGNFTNTVALAWAKPAVGTLKLKEIEVQEGADMRRQGRLIVARMSKGHGILRPECAVEITKAP
jgi:hypothetical protein